MTGHKVIERVTVKTYSGYKYSERPVSFNLCGEEIRILRILGRNLTETADKCRTRTATYTVLGSDGKIYTLSCRDGGELWSATTKG